MAKQVLLGSDDRRLLNEILVRLKVLQDSLDENEIATILRNPKYKKALREAEADIRSGRERSLNSFVRDSSKRS